MGQYPSIKLTMHPSMFNLLMTVLEKNAEAVPQERERERAKELIEKRNKARAEKNWAEADAIRDKLKEMNIVLKDTPMGVKWSFVSE